MNDNEHRTQKELGSVNYCRVITNTGGEESAVVCDGAVIMEDDVFRELTTAKGHRYTAHRREYRLVLCRKPDSGFGFGDLEKVSRFDIVLRIKDRFEDIEKKITDAEPVDIDLDGDWMFRLSEYEGRRLAETYIKAKESLG